MVFNTNKVIHCKMFERAGGDLQAAPAERGGRARGGLFGLLTSHQAAEENISTVNVCRNKLGVHFCDFFCLQNLDIQVEDVRIRAILSSYRKRIPVTEGYVEVKDGGKWKQICNSEWNQLNSRVICGMFGFPGERKYNARVYK